MARGRSWGQRGAGSKVIAWPQWGPTARATDRNGAVPRLGMQPGTGLGAGTTAGDVARTDRAGGGAGSGAGWCSLPSPCGGWPRPNRSHTPAPNIPACPLRGALHSLGASALKALFPGSQGVLHCLPRSVIHTLGPALPSHSYSRVTPILMRRETAPRSTPVYTLLRHL